MAALKTQFRHIIFFKTLLLFTLHYSTPAFSQDVKLFNWTEPTAGEIHVGSKNYNRIRGNTWGITNRSDDLLNNKVLPYAITDPGMSGPDGEVYGIELEFGSLAVLPRSTYSRSLKHYVDCGQTGFQERGHDRSEVHMRRILEEMGVQEGDSLWLGWSEYYKYIDKTRVTTVLQFRNQPSPMALQHQGVIPLDSHNLRTTVNGGPVVAIELWPVKDKIHYHFAIRKGKPNDWTIPYSNKFTHSKPLKTEVWYDFVVNLKYSRSTDGYFRIWHSPANNPFERITLENPTWQYLGPTMYQYPIINGITVKPEPSIRWGIYRFGCKTTSLKTGKPPIDKNNRYMTKFLGPVRFWKGESEVGFDLVKPRN